MTIPQNIRDLIGVAELKPVWQIDRRIDRLAWTAVTPTMVTPDGAALAARLDRRTVPGRQLTVIEERRPRPIGATVNGGVYWSAILPQIESSRRDQYEWRLRMGYRDAAGVEYFEDMGTYFNISATAQDGQTVTTLGSAEVMYENLEIFKPTSGTDMLKYFAEQVMSYAPELRIRNWMREVNHFALGGKYQKPVIGGGVTPAGKWMPTAVADFPSGDVDVWGAFSSLLGASECALVPRDDGSLNIEPVARGAGAPVATFGPADMEGVSESTTAAEFRDIIVLEYVSTVGVAGQVINWPSRNSTPSGYVHRLSTDRQLTATAALAWVKSVHKAFSGNQTEIQFTATARPWLRPSDTITITDIGVRATYMIETITFNPIAGTMAITARSY